MNKINTIAIDLAKIVFQICILSPDQKILKNKQVSRTQLPLILAKQ